MLTTVIIILREFLEAALLISLLSVLHIKLLANGRWIFIATLLGVVGAFLYAKSLADISMWFDGSGQEIIDGIFLLFISLSLGFQVIGINYFYSDRNTPDKNTIFSHLNILTIIASLIIVLAVTREGAEIFVYYSGIKPEKISSMIIGGIIGSGLGVCIGVLLFVSLYQLAIKKLMMTTSILLILISAGVTSEAVRSFIQAGILLASEPVWNSSWIIPEPSVIGQLLYAIFAYEATPSCEEIIAWLITTIVLTAAFIRIHYKNLPNLKS